MRGARKPPCIVNKGKKTRWTTKCYKLVNKIDITKKKTLFLSTVFCNEGKKRLVMTLWTKIEFVECLKHLSKSANVYQVNERKSYCFMFFYDFGEERNSLPYFGINSEYVREDISWGMVNFCFPKENYPETFWVNAGDFFFSQLKSKNNNTDRKYVMFKLMSSPSGNLLP